MCDNRLVSIDDDLIVGISFNSGFRKFHPGYLLK